MPNSKIAFVTELTERAYFIKSLAPPDLDVTLVDLNLSQSEQFTLC